jgi:hypothetical protein
MGGAQKIVGWCIGNVALVPGSGIWHNFILLPEGVESTHHGRWAGVQRGRYARRVVAKGDG